MNNQILEDSTKIVEQTALYALGMLSQTEAEVFERLTESGDSVASSEAQSFDRVVTLLPLSALEISPAPAVRERLLRRVADEAQLNSPVSKPERKQALSDLADRSFSIRSDEGGWKQLAKGVFVKTLFVDHFKKTLTTIVRLVPGARLPRHRHHGTEESFVIEGQCNINGQMFGPGDYRCALNGTIDTELTTSTGVSILMISPQEIEILEPDWSR